MVARGGRRAGALIAAGVGHNQAVDPFTVLGVSATASERELAAAYRELAKLWHPDRRGQDGVDRMAEINVAYELLRAGARHERLPPAAPCLLYTSPSPRD